MKVEHVYLEHSMIRLESLKLATQINRSIAYVSSGQLIGIADTISDYIKLGEFPDKMDMVENEVHK